MANRYHRVIRILKSNDKRILMVKRKRTKGKTMIYITLHRKLKNEQHDPH